MFNAIKRLFKMTDMMRKAMVNITRRLFCEENLRKMTMKECVFEI